MAKWRELERVEVENILAMNIAEPAQVEWIVPAVLVTEKRWIVMDLLRQSPAEQDDRIGLVYDTANGREYPFLWRRHSILDIRCQ